ncbi:hypothetical protein RJ640_024190, partial [Escallonia rubra]
MEGERPDLVSSLPNEIVQLIVSLIPLKDAIRTRALSTVWRSILAPLHVNLDYDSYGITLHEANEELNQIICTFSKSYQSPQLLKITLGSRRDDVFLLAIKGVDKELHLDFFEEKRAITDFSLVLESCCQPIESTSFLSLKTLHLRSVTYLAESFVSSLFSNCPVLETLKLEKCTGLQTIDLKANDCFQKFVVLDCANTASINLCAPSLKSFWYRGVLPTIQLQNTPCLVDVILDLKDGLGHNKFDCEDVLSLVASIKDIEILTLSGWLLEWLCAAGVIFGKLDFKFNKLKELWWMDCLMNKDKRDSLVCFLNMTTSLEKLYVNMDQRCSPVPCPYFHQHWHEPHLWMDYATVKSNTSQLNHLKIVTVVGFTKEEDELLLMDLLLHKAIALRKMTVKSPEDESWSVSKVPKSQLKLISRRYPKHMVVSSSILGSFFVLVEDNNCS